MVRELEFRLTNDGAVQAALQRRADAVFRELQRSFRAIGTEFEDQASRRFRGDWSPNAPKSRDFLFSRTGALRRSGIRVAVTGTNFSSLALQVFITSRYGVLQEFGGEVRPRSKRALTVPLPAAMTAAGVVRQSAGELKRQGGTFLFQTAKRRAAGKGPLVARQVGGDARRLEFLFVLVSKVSIPARWGLRKTWRGSDMAGVRKFEVSQALRRLTRRSA